MFKKPDLSNIDFKKVTIPPRPEAMMKVTEQAKSDDPNITIISEVVSADVGLSAAVLQVVNSPFYGLKRKVTSANQATNLLGVKKMAKLVTSVSLRSQSSGDVDLGRFWDSAEEIANLSGIIAKKLGGVDPDDAYMLGLFHDCGIPIMMQHFEDYKETLKSANSGDVGVLTQYEMKKYGIDHASIGYKLAQEWFLGEDMCEAILYHHECDDVFNQSDASASPAVSLLALLKFAEHISFEIHQGSRSDAATDWDTLGEAVMEYLNLSQEDVNELKDEFKERLEATTA